MAHGVVKWFNDVKGFGFISRDDGEDIFVHQSAVARGYRTLKQGQPVSFDERKGKKGLQAINVRFLTDKVTSVTPKVQSSWATNKFETPIKRSAKSAQLSPPPECVGEKTPLMSAVQARNSHKVKELLAIGVNPNEQDERGTTALMFAVCEGDLDIIKALLKAGGNPNVEACTGDTALSIAHDRKQKHCIFALNQAAHLHQKFTFAPSKEFPRNPETVPQELNLGELPDSNAGRWESSEGFGHSFRENGQFGSFPLHEDYSDEGQADGPRDNEWYDRE